MSRARTVRVAALVACATIACRPRTETAPPPAGPVPVAWYEGDALQARPAADASTSATRVARIDVLLDLLDAARFADDAAAREALWQGLGGTASARGPEATRDAGTRILGDAIKLDAAKDLSDDAREFLAGAIAVLSADLGLVGAADDLAIRTAVYRDVAETGHPRAADNAHWRLYDHVRGCLAGAVAAPQDRRVEVALHSLYVREDSLAPWLDDRAVHAQPPLPAADALIELMTGERGALGGDPRWRVVAGKRAPADTTLEQTVRQTLPAVRDPAWELAVMPVGTAKRDSLVPIVRIDDKQVTVDLGRPDARIGERGAPELVKALEGALARDGRGGVLLVAPPMLPSPAVNSIFRTLYDGRVARIELAVREPRVGEAAGDVVVQLPLEVLRDTDQGPAAVALRKARLHLHLGGRGVRLAVDGRWHDLRPGPSELSALLIALARAYPREHMITVGLGDDLLYQQLLDDLRALIGGPQRRFEVAAWRPAAAPPPEPPPAKAVAAEEKRLKTRFDLYTETMFAALDGKTQLPEGDTKRLEALARQLLRCLPELETPIKSGDHARLDIRFDEGRLAAITVATRVPKPAAAALQRCAEDESKGFRLRESPGAVTVGVLLAPS
jgi:hypothetical protein